MSLRPVRLALLVGLGVLLVLSVTANTVVARLSPPEAVPAACEPWELEGSFREERCDWRAA